MILVIDNYDSFTYNIVHHYQMRGAELQVVRNDELSVDDALQRSPSLILISPGPKSPEHAGICCELITRSASLDKPIPIFGICLGCQALAYSFGARIVPAKQLFHGKLSPVEHDAKGVFSGLPSPLVQTRYHSLAVEQTSLPKDFVVSAWTQDAEVMGIRHVSLPFEGVQFHPESIASTDGSRILDNVLAFIPEAERAKLKEAGKQTLPAILSAQKVSTQEAGADAASPREAGTQKVHADAASPQKSSAEKINASFRETLERVLDGENLSLADARKMMDDIGEGKCSAEEIAMFLIALRTKKETASEISGIALSAREHALPLTFKQSPDFLCDIVGTGGDKSFTFNISTASGIVAAGAGAHVAKHGNRAVSSKCGSADVLEALGICIDLAPERTARMIEEQGFGFLFARIYHPAMKYVAPVRQALKTRTLFNLLGPLINPAYVSRIVLGVHDMGIMELIADILIEMNIEHAMVIHSHNHTDELSAQFPTEIIEIQKKSRERRCLDPRELGFDYSIEQQYPQLIGTGVEENARKLSAIFSAEEQGIARDTVVINAAHLLYVAGRVSSVEKGVEAARHSIDTGASMRCLDAVRTMSNEADKHSSEQNHEHT